MRSTNYRVSELLLSVFLCWLIAVSSAGANADQGAYLGAIPSETPGWFKDSFLEFEEDVAEAAENGRRVMIYFHQEGCPYCAQLVDENFSDETIKSFMLDNFESIQINMWGDREIVSIGGQTFTEKTFAAALKVQYTPTLLFLNEQGSLALRLDGYYPPDAFRDALNYVAEKQESNMTFAAYRAQNQSGQQSDKLMAQDFHLNETNLAELIGKDDKPLAVFFETSACQACEVMHERILIDERTIEQVTQANNVQLDANSDSLIVTPDGVQTTVAEWARQLDINYHPSVVFFDTSGNEVMRIAGFIKTFHFQSVYAYVLEKAYLDQPSFQRYIAARGERIREAGFDTDIWGYKSLH